MRTRLLFIAIIALAGCEQSPGVTADGELLVGKYVDEKVATFLGVPFAEPPVGDLRWQAPQPLTSKLKRRETTEFAAACMQTMRILDWYRYMAETFGASPDYYEDLDVSEDCLYLNLWTPTLESDAKLPVMVWIHGGSNISGWSYEKNYRGHVLAPQGVIVITVAYRQGVFGFLSHPELEGKDAVANFGLWDLVAALQWIQDNVEQFGGDPDRVTLFGESAGGENILTLMAAEPAQHLFHRGVLQSAAGFGLSMPTLQDEQQRGSELMQAVGAKSLQDLRKIDAVTLLEAYSELAADHYHSPAIDGQLITQSTWDAVQAGRFGDHEIIVGTNGSEWFDSVDNDASVDDVVLTARDSPRVGGEAALALVANETDPRRAMDRIITAEAMLCPSQNVAGNRTATGGNAWMYLFTRLREDPGSRKVDAFHGAEYAYVFGMHDDYMTTTDTDLALSAQVQKYWINFAATGNPNGVGLPEWPMFKRPDPLVQELGDEIRTVPAIEPEMCAAFEAWNDQRN